MTAAPPGTHTSNFVKLQVCRGPDGGAGAGVAVLLLVPLPVLLAPVGLSGAVLVLLLPSVLLAVPLSCSSLRPLLVPGSWSTQVQFWGGSAQEVALMQVEPNLPPHSLQVILYHCRYLRLPLSAGGQRAGRLPGPERALQHQPPHAQLRWRHTAARPLRPGKAPRLTKLADQRHAGDKAHAASERRLEAHKVARLAAHAPPARRAAHGGRPLLSRSPRAICAASLRACIQRKPVPGQRTLSPAAAHLKATAVMTAGAFFAIVRFSRFLVSPKDVLSTERTSTLALYTANCTPAAVCGNRMPRVRWK